MVYHLIIIIEMVILLNSLSNSNSLENIFFGDEDKTRQAIFMLATADHMYDIYV
jgi:hypothetical protein